MAITSEFIQNLSSIINNQGELTNNELSCFVYYQRVLKQSKLLSQMLLKSWYGGDEGKFIQKILLHLDKDSSESINYRKMEALLSNGEYKDENNEPQQLDYFYEIFEPEEIKYYLIQIDWNSFEGSVTDGHHSNDPNRTHYFTLRLPYPPKSYVFDQYLKNPEDEKLLNTWLKEDIYDAKGNVTNPFPPLPYIPQTST